MREQGQRLSAALEKVSKTLCDITERESLTVRELFFLFYLPYLSRHFKED